MAVIKKFRVETYTHEETIIELKNISIFYNKRQILDNINLKIKKQEILGMLGPNGVGKSTIFNLITGLKDPTYGEVIINGINCTRIPINERFSKFKLGLVPQYGGIIQDLTLEENLKMVSEIHIKEKNERVSKINKLISHYFPDIFYAVRPCKLLTVKIGAISLSLCEGSNSIFTNFSGRRSKKLSVKMPVKFSHRICNS